MRFLTTVGWILALSFGSTYLLTLFRDHSVDSIRRSLNDRSRYAFVLLVRGQAVRGFDHDHYFYTYRGKLGEKAFETTEEVSPTFFHLHSEGKIVEAVVAAESDGTLHTTLRENNIPFGKKLDALRIVSGCAAVLGGALLAAGTILKARGNRRQ